MSSGKDNAEQGREPALVERQVQRIVNARSATFGLAAVFVVLAVMGAVVMRIVDQQEFHSLGTAAWWALQTVTTVGYGDVVPTTTVGRVVGGIEMVLGVSFIAFVTAGVTSTVVKRGGLEEAEAEREQEERRTRMIIDGMTETREAIAALGRRLDQIESRLTS